VQKILPISRLRDLIWRLTDFPPKDSMYAAPIAKLESSVPNPGTRCAKCKKERSNKAVALKSDSIGSKQLDWNFTNLYFKVPLKDGKYQNIYAANDSDNRKKLDLASSENTQLARRCGSEDEKKRTWFTIESVLIQRCTQRTTIRGTKRGSRPFSRNVPNKISFLIGELIIDP
jgi:hypothetical protein